MIKRNPEHDPVGLISRLLHNERMDFDADQRRAALEKFIHTVGMVVSRWEKDAAIGDGTLRKFLAKTSNTLTDKTYQALAHAAGRKLGRLVAVSELQGTAPVDAYLTPPRSEVRRLDGPGTLPHLQEMERSVPVFGTVSGGPGGLQMGNEAVLDWVRRPPRFMDRKGSPKDIFAVLVEEVSMVPRFGPGDLVYIDPLRAPQIGDCVVVVVKDGQHAEPKAILKRLVARTASKITLEQFNPPEQFTVTTARVESLFRVMTTMDLLGV